MSFARSLHLPAYGGFFAAQFHKMLAYRMRFVTGIVSYFVYVTTNYYIWKAVYDQRAAGATLGGMSGAQMSTWVGIGWIARSFYFNNVDREMAELVQKGDIALTLARPVSFQGTIVATTLGEGLFRLLFFTLPIGAVIFVCFPIARPASLAAGLCFLPSCVLSLLLLIHINFLVGLCAFPLKNIDGVMRAKHYLLELLSGLLIPISLVPPWLATLSRFLPLSAIANSPNAIWTGQASGAGIAATLGEQAAWVVVLATLGAALWHRATKRMTVQGG